MLNPNTDDEEQRQLVGEQPQQLEGATVTSAPDHTSGDDVGHTVYVRPDSSETSELAEVLVGLGGDVQIPAEGSRVVVGYRRNGRPVVVGQRYAATDDPPPFSAGVRAVGHPLSDAEVRFREDGTVRVRGDDGTTVEITPSGDVVIDGGTTKAITDVQASGTNDNGGITGLDITRSPNVYLPSP